MAEDGVSQHEQYYDYDAFGEAFGWELDEPDSGVSRPLTDLLNEGEQLGAKSHSTRHQGDGACRHFSNLKFTPSKRRFAHCECSPLVIESAAQEETACEQSAAS